LISADDYTTFWIKTDLNSSFDQQIYVSKTAYFIKELLLSKN